MEKAGDEYYMRRAIALSKHGLGHVSPNPAVGCVIVSSDGQIIGEGWHRRYGEGHAEVNAMATVRNPALLHGATVYVTLEPCSHYGKTPPCANMLAASPVARVVAGCMDPNPKVSGRGLEILRKAGKEVSCGILEAECRAVNPAFLTSQEKQRPYITLKWACGADSNMGDSSGKRIIYSNAITGMWSHRERSLHDAIIVGRRTALADNPSLNNRHWPGNQPAPIVIGGDGSPIAGSRLAENPRTLWLPRHNDLQETVASLLRDHHITSVLIEGGAQLLNAFLREGLWDRIRRETNPNVMGGDVTAPSIPSHACRISSDSVAGNTIEVFVNNQAD